MLYLPFYFTLIPLSPLTNTHINCLFQGNFAKLKKILSATNNMPQNIIVNYIS